MSRAQIPLVGGFNRSRNVLVNNQATVNFITAIKGAGAKAPMVLETAPGYVELGLVGDGPIRTGRMVSSKIRSGATAFELYGVYGSKLIAHTPTSGNITIGTLGTSSGRVRMARGRSKIALVDGTQGYYYDGTTFGVITDADFPDAATFIDYMDGFYIANDPNTDNWYISAREDPTSWNALDFTAATYAPDAALAHCAQESLLWVMGEESAQAYYNSGNASFPYDRVLSATQRVGILAPQSLANSDDGVFFLATTPEGGRFIYRIQGQAGQQISGDEQDQFLSTISDPSTCYGFIYKQAGKSFYVLQCGATTGADARASSTLVYNMAAGVFETRETNDGTAWRAGGHGILNNENLVGSNLSGSYGRLDLSNYQDAGQELIRTRRTQVVHGMGYEMDFWQLMVGIQSGIGNTDAPNPTLRMRYSDDGGQTWSRWLEKSAGRVGETKKIITFDQLGSSTDRVFEIAMSDAANLVLVDAYVEIEATLA